VLPERLTQEWAAASNSRVWWEAVVLARKAGVVLLAVTLTNPYLQCVGATLWFLGALLLQLRNAPYSKRLFNRLETASLFVSLLTAIISTALLQYNVGVSSADLHPPDAMTGIEWAATVLLAVMNLGTFIVMVGLWLHLQCAPARGASLVTTLSERMRAMLAGRGSSGATNTAPAGVSAVAGVTKSMELRTVNPLRRGGGAAAAAGTRPGGGAGRSVAPAAALLKLAARAPGTIGTSAGAATATAAKVAADDDGDDVHDDDGVMGGVATAAGAPPGVDAIASTSRAVFSPAPVEGTRGSGLGERAAAAAHAETSDVDTKSEGGAVGHD